MTYKIGMVGAPGSGKSTFAAMLYSELLQLGFSGSRLVQEKAQEYLGSGREIKRIKDQFSVTNMQKFEEDKISSLNFDPVICDSAMLMSRIYMDTIVESVNDINLEDEFYKEKFDEITMGCNDRYDLVVYCPLIDTLDKRGQFRIHSPEQSKEIDNRILDLISCLEEDSLVYRVDDDVSQRKLDAIYLAKLIKSFWE